MRSTRDNRLLSALSRLNQGTMSSEPTVMSPEDDEQAYLAKTNTQLNAQRLAQDAGVSHQHSTGRLKPALRSQHSREQGARDPALVSALSRMQEKHSERGLLEFRDHPLVAEPLSQLSSAGAAASAPPRATGALFRGQCEVSVGDVATIHALCSRQPTRWPAQGGDTRRVARVRHGDAPRQPCWGLCLARQAAASRTRQGQGGDRREARQGPPGAPEGAAQQQQGRRQGRGHGGEP